MVLPVNLNMIFGKVRRLTGSSDTVQLPDFVPPNSPPYTVGIADYINSFYLYDFPAEFRSLKLKDTYTFNTVQGQDTYPFDSERYTTVEMPCYCARREIKLFNDKWSFYGVNFNWQQIDDFAYGNGTTGPYSGYTTANPLIRSVNNIPFISQTITQILIDSPVAGQTTIIFNENDFTIGNQVTFNGITGTIGPILNGITFPVIATALNSLTIAATSTGLVWSGGGNATTIASTFSFPAGRVQNVLITANTSVSSNLTASTLHVTDDGNGNLIGDVSTLSGQQGTINYQTGQISNLYFSEVIPSTSTVTQGSNAISVQYNPVQEAIPLSILFFQDQFTLRPVPDQGYTVELTCYRQPVQALLQTPANGGSTELNEWWECIAIGAAKKIYEDRLDFDGVSAMDKMLKERYDVCYTRTYAQIGSQRVNTIYQDQLTGNYGGNGLGFGSGGI
jgi:hypothetical protein